MQPLARPKENPPIFMLTCPFLKDNAMNIDLRLKNKPFKINN